MANLFKAGITLGARDQTTLSAKTHSFEVINFSHYDVLIDDNTMGGTYRLPALCAKTFASIPNQHVEFTLSGAILPTPALTTESIQLRETSQLRESSIIPLSPNNVYTQNSMMQNAVTNPGITQASVGSFDKIALFNPANGPNGGAQYNSQYIVLDKAQGGYIKKIYISAMNISNNSMNGNIYVYRQTDLFVFSGVQIPLTTSGAAVVVPFPISLDFGTGIPNNGILVEVSAAGSVPANTTVYIWGYIVYTTNQNANQNMVTIA